jgi:hypothetical protein
MVLGFPLAVWFGIITIISLVITAVFGILFHNYHKPVFRYHKFFAFFTIIIAIIHIILVILWIKFGISY